MGFFDKALLTGNIVSGWISSARTKKDIQRIYNDTMQANSTSRSVFALQHVNKAQLLLTSGDSADNDIFVYQSKSLTPAIDYIWGESKDPESTVISGGNPDERVRAMMPFIHKSQQDGIPVIALHAGNRGLEKLIAEHSVTCENIAQGNLYYDAFRALPIEDMAYLLYETMPKESANHSAEALILAILEVLLRTEGKVTFQNLAGFPIIKLIDKLNTLRKSGAVTADEFSAISRDYMSGSSEIDAVRSFLNKLNRQAESIYGKATSNPCNIRKVLNMKGVVAIDIGSGNGYNELVLSFVINQLLHIQSTGREFAILIDGIALSRFTKLSDILHGKAFAISHSDFVSSLYGGEKRGEDLFTDVIGNVNTLVLFRHRSGTSCQKWSEHLGKYHKIKIKISVSRTKSFLSGGDTRGIQVDEADEPRVRAETISMLPGTLACIHNKVGTLFAEV